MSDSWATYDRWVTSIPQEHLPECNCENCHLWHLETGRFIENAQKYSKWYGCCVDEMELRQDRKEN